MSEPGSPARMLCLGEALVDLICERPIDELPRADAFVPHFGGAVANVAVVAARHGAAVALAGRAGNDAWGRWLRARLERERVDTSWFELIDAAPTAVAMVAVDSRGEPRYALYDGSSAPVPRALSERVGDAVREAAALFISSNTLVNAPERELTMRARELALELGLPVIFDPNLRLHRWPAEADAAAAANACVTGALLVRTNRAEAALLTGETDPERAALSILGAGARVVVVTLGPEGAIARGEARADAPGVPARVLSTVGAGDVLTGILLARLAAADFDPAAVVAALPEAVEQSARACERWGALE